MPLFIPSPSVDGWQLGPLFVHVYALCVVAGIAAGWAIARRRWIARGGTGESIEAVFVWTVPIGIVGARVYHVLTHLGDYTGPDAANVFAVWEGGIAIYGAIGGGALAAAVVARRRGLRLAAVADTVAPGIAVGQAIGRFGNWFNQELYGRPTTLPWGLEIDPEHRARGFEDDATFHPTFLYEAGWNVVVALTLLWADRRFRLGRGKVFALYLCLYGFGRIFTESLRLDYSYDTFGPLRFNAVVAGSICVAGLALLLWLRGHRPGREVDVDRAAPSSVIASGPGAP